MSVPVDPSDLADSAAAFGPAAYVLTTDGDGRPRITHVPVAIDGSRVTAVVGGSASRNAAERSAVALLWPASEADGFSLIADGTASVRGEPGPGAAIEIEVASAVLHRPAPR